MTQQINNTTTNKHYYALYAPYGLNAAFGPHHAPTVHVFCNDEARDLWVAEDWVGNKRTACTATAARKHADIYGVDDWRIVRH